jgi:hypothetical protein
VIECLATQENPDGTKKRVHYMPDQIGSFKKCPKHFLPLEDFEVDFTDVSYEALIASKNWKPPEAAEYIESLGGTMTATSKDAIARQVVEIRNAQVDIPQ